MEEELNEHDLEERLYAMLHHVDETQNNLTDPKKFDVNNFVENSARSTVRRYWRSGAENNPYQKVNTPKEPVPPSKPSLTQDNTKPKEETSASPRPPSPVDLSIFQAPIPQNVKKTIEFLDHEDENPVVLESSDEDEVIEVALPPKPTITIESSDEDDLHIVKPQSPTKTNSKSNSEQKQSSGERAVSSSPVPSVVSSVSDEFIRGDCIALNISSHQPDKHSFDFSLHGSDLLIQNTPSKKKKRKKNKEAVTSTPINTPAAAVFKSTVTADGCFATPKSKAKNKKQKRKSLTEKSIPNVDIYDSDSNQGIADTNTNINPYIVTEKSLPSADVYESDSNQSEIVKEINTDQSKKKLVYEANGSDTSSSNDKPEEINTRQNKTLHDSSMDTVDLTDNDSYITIDKTGINESIVMANVTGLREQDLGDKNQSLPFKKDISKYVSSKVPSILYEDLDFDNLKGIEKVGKKRRYSRTSLRAEMEKFYNESWGGEDFNHREIQKNMSRDKNLWAIDPKDRMPSLAQRKTKCNYCNRVGHRDDTCRQKPPICYMCGNTGHFESRCPTKICVNCGASNFMYSTMCRNCSCWPKLKCAECGQAGHPASHCPDLWRRYHNTLDTQGPLEKAVGTKKHFQQYCSGCSRRGHLVHVCRVTIPFSGLPINSPYVFFYRAVYPHIGARSKNSLPSDSTTASVSPCPDRNKRHSKSPTVHETHVNKKRNLSLDDAELQTKSPSVQKSSTLKDTVENTTKNKSKSKSLDSCTPVVTEMSDFVSISSNRDNEGHMIQDNEVSDTSDVVTSARIYVTNDIINKLKTTEGEDWLKSTMAKLNVEVGNADVNSFLSIKGKLADQEAFQTELREWTQAEINKGKTANDASTTEESTSPSGLQNLPKNRNNLLRQLNKALDLLKQDLGDPKALYQELTFSQNKHLKLLKQKVISHKTLSNSRTRINDMLKKLNIILLGQAGLAEGTAHITELQFFKEKLMNSRQKTISPVLRKEIGDHYNCIFSSCARDDYTELMKKYYLTKTTVKLSKRKRKKKSKQAKLDTVKVSKADDSVPSKENMEKLVINPCSNGNNGTCNTIDSALLLRNLLKCLAKITRLQKAGKCSNEQNNVITQIRRRVHPFIVILKKNHSVTSKTLKKIRKGHQMALQFLANA